MPTREYADIIYPEFGVQAFHDAGHWGHRTSIYIIDTGLTNTSDKLSNVSVRTVTNAMGPKNTHGSFVASIVGAKASASPDKVPGIAPESQIYLADVSTNGKIYTSALVKAIHDAIDLQVDIISISLGTNVYDQGLENAVNKAKSKGILVFAASGNCSCRAYEFPGACDAAISVASIDIQRRKSPFNTRNDSVAVFAPGQNIKVPGSKSRLSGTSFAVPFASALAALELSKRRAVDPKAMMTRDETISALRGMLGLTCSEHTYSNDVCTGTFAGGPFVDPNASQGLLYFIVLAVVSGAFLLLAFHFWL